MVLPEITSVENQFRIYPPLPDDLKSNVIKIEKSKMDSLGIKTGEIVRVIGTSSTCATCLPLEDKFKNSNDPEIIYVPEISALPQARPGGITMENIAKSSGQGLISIEIEKVDSSIVKSITLHSVNPEFDKNKFDNSVLYGMAVCEGNKIFFRDPDFQLKSGFVVGNLEPEGVGVIDSDSKIEFSNCTPQSKNPRSHRTDFKKLQRVIALSKQFETELVTITIPSIEIYEEGIRIHLYMHGTYGNRIEFANSHPNIDVLLKDGKGTPFDITVNGGGGSSGPMEFDYKWNIISGPPPKESKFLNLTIPEIRFQQSFTSPQMRRDVRNPARFVTRHPEYSEIEKFPSIMIHHGKWNVHIPLEQK